MKKFFSLLVVAVMLCSIMGAAAGCGKKVAPLPPINLADFTETLTAEKIGNIQTDSFTTCPGGLYYKDENGRYGVMSLEGNKDTGAIYASVTNRDVYFEVSTVVPKNFSDIVGLNSYGLIDGKGKQLIPNAYAEFRYLNDRFVCVMNVTERTFVEDDAVLYYSQNAFDFSTEKAYFEGKWCIYDITTGKIIPGVSGTKEPQMYAQGSYVTYKDEATEKYVTVDAAGVALPENAKRFDDGSYAIEEKIGTVYNSYGEKLFAYDLTGYIPDESAGDYYIAETYVDGVNKYVVMDKTGKVVSAEFTDRIELYGDLVFSANKIYNLEGTNIIDGDFSSVKYDAIYEGCWLLRTDDDVYYMIKEDGSIVYRDRYTDNTTIYSDDFVAQTKKDGNYYYWSHADKDYTIQGYSFAPWVVKTDGPNSLYNLVNTITGEIMLEGYNNYSYSRAGGTALYVYAKYNGGTDVYLIVNPKMLAEMEQKKSRLLGELTAAFKNAGITVAINEETGEMSMDSSVLFGGDSAVLSAEGKNFLNKFIDVYTRIAFNGEYAGFIAKTMVEGHTAPLAGSTYASGLPLSEERAKVVKDYCLSGETGVNVSSIAKALEDVGYSNSQPVYDGSGNVDLDASRRVSFRFMINIDIL
ncbi:MAG: OmpA family protein [Clostridia bacterium]|nr:OmpA family protein [Clostridia bacterium]